MKIIRATRKGAVMISASCVMMACPMHAQIERAIPDGYYTLSTMVQDGLNYLYSYDTNALRDQYGNAIDYAHPMGKNGEHAYLYLASSTTVNQANKTFYLRKRYEMGKA